MRVSYWIIKPGINHTWGDRRVTIHISWSPLALKLTNSNLLTAMAASDSLPAESRFGSSLALSSFIELPIDFKFVYYSIAGALLGWSRDGLKCQSRQGPFGQRPAPWKVHGPRRGTLHCVLTLYGQCHQFQICLLQFALRFNMNAPSKRYPSAWGAPTEMGSENRSWRSTDGVHFHFDSAFIFHSKIRVVQLLYAPGRLAGPLTCLQVLPIGGAPV